MPVTLLLPLSLGYCNMILITKLTLLISKQRYASEGPLQGILGYTDEDVVSNDFVGDSRYFSLNSVLYAC